MKRKSTSREGLGLQSLPFPGFRAQLRASAVAACPRTSAPTTPRLRGRAAGRDRNATPQPVSNRSGSSSKRYPGRSRARQDQQVRRPSTSTSFLYSYQLPKLVSGSIGKSPGCYPGTLTITTSGTRFRNGPGALWFRGPAGSLHFTSCLFFAPHAPIRRGRGRTRHDRLEPMREPMAASI